MDSTRAAANRSNRESADGNLASISPFIVKDLQASIAFYIERFGFQLDFQGPPDDVDHGQVSRDGIGIMLKTIAPDVLPCPNHTRHAWARWDAYIYTLDPDALFDEFKQRGASFVKELSFIDDGLWGFEVTDGDGYVLAFFRPATSSADVVGSRDLAGRGGPRWCRHAGSSRNRSDLCRAPAGRLVRRVRAGRCADDGPTWSPHRCHLFRGHRDDGAGHETTRHDEACHGGRRSRNFRRVVLRAAGTHSWAVRRCDARRTTANANWRVAGRAGLAAWIGFLVGTMAKVGLAFVMVGIFLTAWFVS